MFDTTEEVHRPNWDDAGRPVQLHAYRFGSQLSHGPRRGPAAPKVQELALAIEGLLVQRQEMVLWLETLVLRERERGGGAGGATGIRRELLARLQEIAARQEALLTQMDALIGPPRNTPRSG